MDHLENEIRNRLQDATSSGGVNADELWGAIENEIIETPVKTKPFLFEWPAKLLMVALVLLSVSSVFYFSKNKKNDQLENKPIVVVKNEPTEITGNKPTILKPIKVNNLDEEENAIGLNKGPIENNFSKESFNSKKPIHSKKAVSKTVEPNNTLVKNESIILNEEKIAVTSIEKETPERVNENTSSLSEINLEENKSKKNIAKTGLIKQLKNNPLFVNSENEDSPLFENIIDPVPLKLKNKKISFGLFVGSHFISNNFKAEQDGEKERSSLLNKGYQPELGYSFSAEAVFHLNKNLFVKSGITYVSSTEKFNYTNSYDTTIWKDNIPNTEMIDALATRRVRHHNKHTLYSIPLMIGVQQQKGRVNFGINAGVGFNFIISQKGRSLDANDLIADFPNGETNVSPRPSFYMSYQLQPFLNYRFNEKLTFQIRSDMQYHAYGKFGFYGMKHNAVFGGVGIGVVYRH